MIPSALGLNGTKATFDYEASGCGGLGEVHRFDDTYRLTDEYWGVDISGINIDTYADPINTPTSYAFNKHYNLDTRGNRTSVVDSTDTGAIIKDTSFSADASTNVYNAVDGQSYTYDDAEQMTFDPSTGMHHAYDYKGQLIESDDDADFPSAERRYYYDTHGRLRVEERWVNESEEAIDYCENLYLPNCQSCGCSAQQPPIAEDLNFPAASPATATSTTHRR